MTSYLVLLVLCIAFVGILKLVDVAFAEENSRRRRIRRLQKSQDWAMTEAEQLIVFDQTLTREHLIREWEKM